VPRWALRFWPDTRKLIDDDIGLDAFNHGTITAEPSCALNGCAPAVWQQRNTSAFIAALNSYQETFPGISYTEVYSYNDEMVVPNTSEEGSSSVHTGGGAIANIAVQQVCPGHAADHLAMGSYDAVGCALELDAITHAGPAQAGADRPRGVRRTIPAQVAGEYVVYALRKMSQFGGRRAARNV
jgi:hypothetical protein